MESSQKIERGNDLMTDETIKIIHRDDRNIKIFCVQQGQQSDPCFFENDFHIVKLDSGEILLGWHSFRKNHFIVKIQDKKQFIDTLRQFIGDIDK